MAGHGKPTPQDRLVILERRKKVAARYLRGDLQWEIARAFEVSLATVERDLAELRKEWLAQAVADIDAVKARELAKLDNLERIAHAAWERSQQDAQTLKARTSGGGQSGQSEIKEKVLKGQVGDIRFLDLILKCVKERCEIMGAYKPKVANPNQDGEEMAADELATALNRILAIVGEANADAAGQGPGDSAGPSLAGPDSLDAQGGAVA